VDKAEVRRQFMGRHPQSIVASKVVEGLFTWMSARLPGTVAAYLAFGGEIDVEPLFSRLPGWRWVLPRIEEDLTLTFRDRDVPRETHKWGMSQPVGQGDVISVQQMDLMLVPGQAFDWSGGRLGRAAGYYDRLLAERRPDCLVIGVTWSERVVVEVPMEQHDRRVDYLATEDGVTQCSPKQR
jgi:5-formyltetrahydrofolate cyclo-ligase